MAHIPPFRTRRSEPVISLDEHPADETADLPPDDDALEDVPTLTQVVEPSALAVSEPVIDELSPVEADFPPIPTVTPLDAEDEDTELNVDDEEELLDILADEVTDRIQPMLRELVRTALQQALAARRQPDSTPSHPSSSNIST